MEVSQWLPSFVQPIRQTFPIIIKIAVLSKYTLQTITKGPRSWTVILIMWKIHKFVQFLLWFILQYSQHLRLCSFKWWGDSVNNEVKRIWKDGTIKMLSQFSGTEKCHGHTCQWQVFREANHQLLIGFTPALWKRIFCYTCSAPIGQQISSTVLLLLICFTSRK